jgi:hypothetical protein
MIRAEYFHTDRFADKNGYNRSLNFFNPEGKITKSEYYKDDKLIEKK